MAGHGRERNLKLGPTGRVARRTGMATVAVGCLAALAASAPPAAAAVPTTVAAARPDGTGAKVVEVTTRGTFGQILADHMNGLTLYTHPGGPCTGSCLSVWPALELPKGKTKPLGAHCLGTVALGTRLQVTYMKQALYTFTGDSGTSVNGNDVDGFEVAEVASSCP